jgi:hypothetical protein
MNKLKLLVSIFMFVSLVFVFSGTSSVAALSPSGPVGNQVFYSTSIQEMITLDLPGGGITNQQFYSPFIGSIIAPVPLSGIPKASAISNQVFYSPFVGSIINPSLTSGLPNQVFYSPMIESFIH